MTDLSPAYFRSLVTAIARHPAFHGEIDDWLHSLYFGVTETLDIYATPGWEGAPNLPFHGAGDGAYVIEGTITARWSGDLEQDVKTYLDAVALWNR